MNIINITLFPEMFAALNAGITGRAQKRGLVTLNFINPRDFAKDNYSSVDDRPFGGGPGMVMLYQPLKAAITQAKQNASAAKVIHLSPQGKLLKHPHIEELAKTPDLILLSGRYEGIDQRIIDACVDEEYSIGDYVLSGGELAAMVLIDAITRLLPEALGHEQSAAQDSFVHGLLDCPHYTRPELIDDRAVPKVLLSGNHVDIAKWRHQQALGHTYQRRRDLFEAYPLTKTDKTLLNAYLYAIDEKELDNE